MRGGKEAKADCLHILTNPNFSRKRGETCFADFALPKGVLRMNARTKVLLEVLCRKADRYFILILGCLDLILRSLAPTRRRELAQDARGPTANRLQERTTVPRQTTLTRDFLLVML